MVRIVVILADSTLEPKAPKGEDDFAEKIAQLNLDNDEAPADEAQPEAEEEVEGDFEAGTGIFAHDENKAIPYDLLLSRFFSLLAQKNPDHASSGSRSYKIPPPQCLREGNKKTIFANLNAICIRMKRTDEVSSCILIDTSALSAQLTLKSTSHNISSLSWVRVVPSTDPSVSSSRVVSNRSKSRTSCESTSLNMLLARPASRQIPN